LITRGAAPRLFEEASGVFGGCVVLFVVDRNSFNALLGELQRDPTANTARCPCDQSCLLCKRDWHDALPFARIGRIDLDLVYYTIPDNKFRGESGGLVATSYRGGL
jgi:hypothetical protein